MSQVIRSRKCKQVHIFVLKRHPANLGYLQFLEYKSISNIFRGNSPLFFVRLVSLFAYLLWCKNSKIFRLKFTVILTYEIISQTLLLQFSNFCTRKWEEGCVHHFKLNYLLLCGNAFAHSNNSLKCAYLTREKEEKGIFILNPLRVKRREREFTQGLLETPTLK